MSIHITGLNETIRDLQRLGVDASDIKAAFSSIAAEGAQVASRLAPQRTGRLAASVRGNRSKNKAVVTAGRGQTSQYAGIINYGYPRRNIHASHFLQRADAVIAPRAVEKLDKELSRMIRQRGF